MRTKVAVRIDLTYTSLEVFITLAIKEYVRQYTGSKRVSVHRPMIPFSSSTHVTTIPVESNANTTTRRQNTTLRFSICAMR